MHARAVGAQAYACQGCGRLLIGAEARACQGFRDACLSAATTRSAYLAAYGDTRDAVRRTCFSPLTNLLHVFLATFPHSTPIAGPDDGFCRTVNGEVEAGRAQAKSSEGRSTSGQEARVALVLVR